MNQETKENLKQLHQKEFNCNTINIFIESHSSAAKKKKGHCVIGIFNADKTQLLDLLSAKTYHITPGQNIVDEDKIYEQIQFDKYDDYQNEMLTSIFTITGSYLDEVFITRHIDLISRKESIKNSPAISKFCVEFLQDGKITYKDISRMGYEFNELFIKKYRENKKNKLNDESKLMEQ